jgi:hypothetical protein
MGHDDYGSFPKRPNPDLLTTPRDTVQLDDLELERQKELDGIRLDTPGGEQAPCCASKTVHLTERLGGDADVAGLAQRIGVGVHGVGKCLCIGKLI